MAVDDNVPFSSLDSLGPEYGSINTPTIDAKGLAAFEGDRIDMPKINFPETQSFTPVLPDVENLTNPATEVRKTVVGTPPSKPGINKNASFDQLRKSMKDYALGTLRSNADKNQYGKIYSYNAGPDGNAFYKRYQAYGQDKFDEIGFSPIRDNEALFNARTTQWDDFSRMMTNSFVPLFTRGFLSGPKSLGKMLTGDFTGTDLEDAAAYEEASAIGQSSKGGFGAFTSNAMMNFAYSAGIITEAVLEEVALGLATVGTAGIAAPALFARTAANVARVGRAVYKGINFATDGMKAINKTLDTVNSVKGAREFWNATKGFAKTVNPLANTFDAYKLANQADNFTNLGRAYKTAGGFYRDVRNINMALSESRLEAGMVENSIYDNLYNEYYAKNNESPSDEIQYEMMKQAKKGSLNTLYWNTGLIYGSNLITFPNIVGPKGGLRNFSRATVKELSEVSGGKFGKLGKVVYDQTSKKFAFEKNNFKNYIKGWAKDPIYKSVGNTVGYFKSNFTEGIQENLQEVIGGANERYYSDTFKSGAVQSHNYSKSVSQYDYFSDELGKQFSSQGFETFASGFIMGTFASPLNKSFEYLGVGFNRMFNKEDYQKLKDKKLEITKDLVNNLNGIDVKDFLDAKIFNYGQQDIISKIKESGSKKEAMDADHEALLNQMDLLVRNGSLESYQEKLRDLQQLTPEEFEDAVPNVPKGEGAKYQTKINDTIDKMDKINSRYKTYKDKFQNPIDPDNLPPKGTPEYENAVTLHNAWEDATKNAVFFNETFEDTMKRKRDIIQKFNTQKPLQSLTQRDSEVIFDNDKLRNEVGLLKNEIESLKQLKDPASKEELKKKESKLAAMQKLGESTVSFTNFFNRYERSAEIREVLQKEKGDEPVTDEEVEAVMDEYFGEFSDDNKIKQTSEYETAFKEYLKTVANVNKDYLFDEKVDEAFELLADHHKLDSESRALIKGVNLLHDPAGFLDLVERNQKWMKDLYARRGEYYQKMITDQFDIVVDNALLNALANKSVYISMDDFAAWKNEGIPPSEFYDHARKLVIPEGTEAYDVYYMLFDQAAQLKAEKSGTVPSSLDAVLNADLEKLESQKEAELKNVPMIETKVSKGKLEPNSSGQVTAKMVQEQLQPNTYAEASYGAEDNFILFMDEEGNLRENDAEGDLVQVDTVPVTFTSVETYVIAERPNPEYVQEIEKRYEELKEDRINQYTEQVEEVEKKEKEKKTSELEPITSATSLEDIITRSPALYNKLNKEFNERVIKKMDSEEYVNMNPEQERNLFEKFLQSDPIAKGLIDTYNKEQKLDEATKETGEKEEFEFMYQGKMVKTADLKTIQDLEKMKRRFDKMIKDISESENPTTEDMTNKSKYSIISKDLEKLINTRTNNDAKVSDEITADEYNNFVDNGIVKAGRITKIAEKVKNGTDLTQQEKEMFQDKTSEINEELRKMSEKETAKAKPSDIEAKKADIERRTTKVISSEIVEKGNMKGQTRTVTQTNTIEDLEGTLVSVTEYEAKVGDTTVSLGGRTMTFKEFKEEFPLDEDYEEILGDWPDLNDDSIITVRKVKRTPSNSRFKTVVSIFSSTLEGKMDVIIKQDDTKYDTELAALESTSAADTIPENPQSSDDVDSPTQDSDSRKVEVIDDAKRYSIDDFKADVAKVKTMDELQQIVSDLHIKVSEEAVAFEDLQVMSELAKQKAAEIKAGDIKIDPIGLTESTQLIAKEIIFDDAKMFAMTNDTLVVKSVDKTKKTITVTPMGSTEEMTVGFDKLNEMFILKDTVMDTTEQVKEPVTKEEQDMVTQSSDLADTILNSPDQLTELEKTVSNKTIKELDAELLEDLKC